jgi:hypothetical protein
MLSLSFEPKIDVGHFLTSLTLIAGFFWWLYTSIRGWRQKSNDEARSGALRLLLKILRDCDGRSMSIDALHETFHASALREQRIAYCGRDYRFKSIPVFEAAIYRLDWEGKVDFPSSNEVVFRVDSHKVQPPRFVPTQADTRRMLAILADLLNKQTPQSWEIEAAAESCMLVAPEATAELLRNSLNAADPNQAQCVLAAMRRLVPQRV